MSKSNRGREVENLVGEISSAAFLHDFVVPNPEYRQNNGLTKEAADFVVPFGEAMLAYQVKSKTEIKSGSEKSQVDFKRIQKVVEKGIGQLKTIQNAMEQKQIDKLVNTRSIELPFDRAQINKVHGIVIIELLGEEKFSEEEKTSLYGGYTFKHGMPIHVFRLSDYRQIAVELDTLPDFIEYLEIRQQFYERRILIPLTEELDYLAFYKTSPELVEKCLNGDCQLLTIQDGMWESYLTDHRKEIDKRTKENKASYVIDKVIAELHTSLGFDTEVDIPPARNKHEQGTIENYIAGVTELSKMNRITRRVVGQKFLERMEKAERTGHGHSLIMNVEENSAVLVLSSNKPRQERANALYNLCSVAYSTLNLARIVGIVSEPLKTMRRSFDIVVFQDVEFENRDDLEKLFAESFGPKQNYQVTEY